MDLQDKYDELENLISNLETTIDDLNEKEFKDYVDMLRDIKYRAEDELDEIEPKLQEEFDKESKRQLNEFIKSVL